MICPCCNGTGEVPDRPTGSAVSAIEHYYRSRARGSRMTLKELAGMSGYGYNYLRDVKVRYDRDPAKWGSKASKARKQSP